MHERPLTGPTLGLCAPFGIATVMWCVRWATKQRQTAAYHPKSQMASREIRAKVKIDGEAGTGHHSA
jgi:hypothetical protein